MPCMVRLRRVDWPAIILTGFELPFADLANTAMRGWLTQLGTSS
jgi:hypothetical protein